MDDYDGELECTKETDRLKLENAMLKDALRKIADPLKHLIELAKSADVQMSGAQALTLAKDASYLREVAQNALKAIDLAIEGGDDT